MLAAATALMFVCGYMWSTGAELFIGALGMAGYAMAAYLLHYHLPAAGKRRLLEERGHELEVLHR